MLAMRNKEMALLFGLLAILSLGSYVDASQKRASDYLKKEHSLMRPYTGAGASMPMWDFIGSTIVTNNYIRLTPDRQSKRGAIWNKIPNESPNWEIHLQFKVHGQGKTLYGDGFAIWYTKERMQLGQVFGSKDYHIGLGIFFDTYSNHNGPHNHEHPYISVLINDGKLRYDHDRDGTHNAVGGCTSPFRNKPGVSFVIIRYLQNRLSHPHPYISAQVNNGSLHYDHDTDGTHTEVAGCSCSIRNKNHITQVAIRYSRQRLTIMTDIDGKSEWKPCVDVPGIHLPTGYYFGASAATGQLADNHDIISYKLFELDVEGTNEDYDYANVNPSADFFAPPRDHVDDPKGAFKNVTLTWKKMFLLVFCILLGIAVCIIVGVLVFMKRQEHNRKRFY